MILQSLKRNRGEFLKFFLLVLSLAMIERPVYCQGHLGISKDDLDVVAPFQGYFSQAAHFSFNAVHKGGSERSAAYRHPPALRMERISPDFSYTNCYGVFCRLEWMTQKKLHLPVSIRLGSYNYERKLEAKLP